MKVFIISLIIFFVSCDSTNRFAIDITKMKFKRQQGIDAGTVMEGHRLFEGEIESKPATKKLHKKEVSKKITDKNGSKSFFSNMFNFGNDEVQKVIKECEEIIDEDTKIFSNQQNAIETLSNKNKKMEKYIDSLQNELLISKRATNRYRAESRRLNSQNENLDNLIDLLSREIQ